MRDFSWGGKKVGTNYFISPFISKRLLHLQLLVWLSEGILKVSVTYYYLARTQLDRNIGHNLKKGSEQLK